MMIPLGDGPLLPIRALAGFQQIMPPKMLAAYTASYAGVTRGAIPASANPMTWRPRKTGSAMRSMGSVRSAPPADPCGDCGVLSWERGASRRP
jgi:hypothetical protein